MDDKKANIVFAICMIVITITLVYMVYKITQPEKIYIQKWTNPETEEVYYLTNANIKEAKGTK